MKSNKLNQILNILESPNPNLEIKIDPTTIEKAKHCLMQMFKYSL